MNVTDFINTHYHHFNAGSLKAAAKDYIRCIAKGHKMMVTLGGAMSTARLGISLAEMIRQDKVHAICCTGANLEEDLLRMIGGKYQDVDWRNHRAVSETYDNYKNRVLDTCIPEEEVENLATLLQPLWKKTDEAKLPHQYFYELIDKLVYRSDVFDKLKYKDSWLFAAWQKQLPLFVPGWEDSTMGNIYVAEIAKMQLSGEEVLGGCHYMADLITWYGNTMEHTDIGFFQIGGGIAGDFPICVVPLMEQALDIPTKKWSYFCQISDSTTSYGSYSGATPNEKISWGKLNVGTPSHIIESDATIVAPLLFAMVMGE